MFKLMPLHLPWNLGTPPGSTAPRPLFHRRKGHAQAAPRSPGRVRLWLRRRADETMMIIRNEGGALRALYEQVPTASEGPGHARRATARLDSDALSSADDLVAGMVHDIRNPLTAIRIWMFSIQEAVEGDPELNRRCALVCQEISRLERLSRSFLEYTRLPRMCARPLDIPPLLDEVTEVLKPLLQSLSAEVHRSDAVRVPPALADPEQLTQVLTNLLSNAAEALSGGGDIFVSTDYEDAEGDPMVVIRIRDTGPGMPHRVGQKILEPLASSKHHGKGLGLYIAARITENHGGRLSIESSTGAGTTIAVRIPAAYGGAYGYRSRS